MSNDQSSKNRKPDMGKADPGTIKRIFSYIFQYKWRVVAIVVCILIGAAAQAGSAPVSYTHLTLPTILLV